MGFSTLIGLLFLVQASSFTPERFFVGRTEGTGTVNIMLSGSHAVRTQSRGRIDQSGALVIDQRVAEVGKPARVTTWRLMRAASGRLTGTATSARGPVTGQLTGNVLVLRYRSAEGPSVEQSITFLPGGRTARNRLTYRRYGVTVATVEETIRKMD